MEFTKPSHFRLFTDKDHIEKFFNDHLKPAMGKKDIEDILNEINRQINKIKMQYRGNSVDNIYPTFTPGSDLDFIYAELGDFLVTYGDRLGRCIECQEYFFKRTNHKKKFCSTKCHDRYHQREKKRTGKAEVYSKRDRDKLEEKTVLRYRYKK